MLCVYIYIYIDICIYIYIYIIFIYLFMYGVLAGLRRPRAMVPFCLLFVFIYDVVCIC